MTAGGHVYILAVGGDVYDSVGIRIVCQIQDRQKIFGKAYLMFCLMVWCFAYIF